MTTQSELQDIINQLNCIPIPDELEKIIRKKSWSCLGHDRDLAFAVSHDYEDNFVMFYDPEENRMNLGVLVGLELSDLEVLTEYADECLDVLHPLSLQKVN